MEKCQSDEQKKEILNIEDVNICALSIRKVLIQLRNEMKDNKNQHEYFEYLKRAYSKMTSAMIYAQELKKYCH